MLDAGPHTLRMRAQRNLFRVLHAVTRRPRTALLAALAAVLPLAAAGSGLRPDNSLSVWFVEHDPALAEYRRFLRQFGSDEVAAIAYRAPGDALAPAEAVVQRRAAERVEAVDGIAQVLAPGVMADTLGRDSAARGWLRRAGLVSADGRTAVLLARMDVRDDIDARRGGILDSLRASVDATLGAAGRPAHYAGIGVVYDALNRQTIRDSAVYLGIAFVVMAVLLWLALRRWRAVAIAIVPPVLVSVMTTGLFALTGRPFTQVTSILPMLVLVIGLSDAIHLITHYYADRRAAGPVDEPARRELVARSAAWVALPNLFTALTTAAGFLALASSRMPAIRDLGLFAAAAMLMGWVMTLVVGAAALALWDLPPPPERARGGRIDRALAWLSVEVRRARWAVLGVMALVTTGLLVLTLFLRVDTYTIDLLPPGHVARQDSRWIERNAGNYVPLEYVVRAGPGQSVLDPDVLERTVRWQRYAERDSRVERTFGFPDLAPLGRAAPGGPYVSADGREGRVTLFVPMTSTAGFQAVIDELSYGGDPLEAAGGSLRPAGYLPLYLRIVDYVVSGTVWGLAISTLIVFAMVGLLLRSWRLTLAAVPTNLFPVALVFGIMGWTGIPLDIATATIGAIVLGIAVDDTIHFLFRYRAERQAGTPRQEAVARTYRETGRAVVYASLVLAIGFAVLATSSSRSIAYFGIVSSLAILGAMLADLLLLPAILLLGSRETVPARDASPAPASAD
ncbi:MAG TPA: efflux RND transporter permease subunit [Longimicrobium sp.]|nr:efflux RND transporter permease subunit [Longimicrobium sp.]